jgi:DtxR family Mn-dependent transcriptional regulator
MKSPGLTVAPPPPYNTAIIYHIFEKNPGTMQTFCGITTDGMLDYLASIYRLGNGTYSGAPGGEKVTTSALAEQMHVSAAAASSMLKRLEESGFVERSSVDGITLTEQGRLAALQLIRRHRLLEVFLVQVMGFTWDQVDSEAHRLEHAISAAFEERMERLCGYPAHCPHGDPIPRKDGSVFQETLVAVTAMSPGQVGVLRRVGNSDARVLRYLAQLALEPGRALRLVEAAPFNGPITLELVNGGGMRTPPGRPMIGSELAGQLYVRLEPVGANG